MTEGSPNPDAGARRVSVVVVNKDDPRVGDTLSALLEQDDPCVAEVIVVDASNHRLDKVRDAHRQVHWIDYTHPTGKARTIAEQRNVGVSAAVGDVVAFLDANCIPSVSWATELTAPIRSGAELVVVGRVASSGDDSIHDVGKGQGAATATYLEECSNMTTAVHRRVFETVGTFDEELGFAEDVDFSWRVRDCGIRILLNPLAVVRHEWGSTREDLPRAFRYGVGRVRLYRHHRSRRGALLKGDLYITIYAAFTASLPIAIVFPPYLALLAVPLFLNRRRRPFFAVTYRLVYSLGVLSELAHLPVTKGQRRVPSPSGR